MFDEIWPFVESYSGERLKDIPKNVHAELLDIIALSPLAIFNMRALISQDFTISDASETGAGMCSAATLTDEGFEHFPK